ncbi:hypothetical protein PFNF54_05940 [Plasmodium falciparum NF54]|nr:hypothetical protein PFNF54_05940 [Plasmodium falciparum NF54]
MNEEAIKKYQETHDPYKQLKEVVEKNGTKYTGGNDAEPMSTLEKELLETYEEIFGGQKDIMLKSGMNTNDDNISNKLSTCECTDTNNMKLESRKGKDKYLKNLKHRCIGGICSCSVGSAFLTILGFAFAKAAAMKAVADYTAFKTCVSSISTFNLLDSSTLLSSFQAISTCVEGATDMAGTIATPAMAAFYPWGIAALVLLILVVVLIILYIWLYRRRKNSWKHECKKHLCK